eukprot:7963017-Ditylum_brightwellii.AAC.1
MPSNKKKINKKSKSKKGGVGTHKTNKKTTKKEKTDKFVSKAGPGYYIAHHPKVYTLITSSSTLSTTIP